MNKSINPTLSSMMIEFTTRSTAIIFIETSTLLLIALIAIGENLLVIISFYRNPSLRTITNYFVLSLAITDIVGPITLMPPTLIWSAKSRFVLGKIVCDFQAIMLSSLSTLSIITITLMAINRFIRVCNPQKYKKLFNKKKSLVMIGIVWFITFAVTLLFFFKSGGKAYFMPHRMTCLIVGPRNTSESSGNSVVFAVILLPFTIIVYCYYKVFKKIRQHKKNIAPSSSNQNTLTTNVQEINLTWVLFAVVMGYFLTWIPVILLLLLTKIKSNYVPRQGKIIITYAGVSCNAINPIIYGALNAAFRKEFASILKCK